MEVKYILIELFLVIALVNQVLAGTDTVNLSGEDEEQKLYEQLFRLQDAKYTSFTPRDVMEKLERLVAIYNSNSYDIDEPVYQPENKKKIMDVYNVITELNCDKEAIVKFNELLRSLAVYGNLSRTLKMFRDERFMKCKTEYPQELYKTVNAMGFEKRYKVMTLRDEILTNLRELKDDMPFYTPEAFDKGVLAYLARYPGAYREKWKKDKMISKSELATLYDNEVVSMCSSLGNDFYKEADYFLRVVATDSTLARMNDSTARFWMINSYICQDATKRKQQVIESLHKLMIAYSHPKRRSLLKWFRDENAALMEFKEMGTKYTFIELLLVVPLINQTLAGTDTVNLSGEDEGQKLYEQLFRLQDAKYTSFTPRDVMEKLERLVAIYNSNSYDIGEPVYQPENKKKIMDVYNVITKLNCDRKALIKFNDLMRSLSEKERV